ncbi:MAG: DoxX family protein [Pikeienuella sp.]
MNDQVKKYGLWTIKAFVGLAFIATGSAKLFGAEMMVATFDAIGVGQWFRYGTGAIEVVGAMLLFAPRKQAVGATLLLCTMVGAVLAHLFIIGPSAVPAVILGALTATVLFAHRDQLPKGLHLAA